MLTPIFAAVLALGAASPGQQEPDPTATRLPDVQVTAERGQDRAMAFVRGVAAPADGRGLAQWRGPVCPGVVNLRADVGQPILDRISDNARALGLETGRPGCRANLVVIFTDDGAAMARRMIDADPRLFRTGVSGFDRGQAALERFGASLAAARWWPLSMPVDAVTGARAARVPGDRSGMTISSDIAESLGCPGGCNATDSVLGAAPITTSTTGSRLSSMTVDALYKVIIIVDTTRTGPVTTASLADYVSMVGLAQIDDEADVSGFDTVLNLFEGGASEMTEWDWLYLQGLYGSRRNSRSANDQMGDIASAIGQERRSQE